MHGPADAPPLGSGPTALGAPAPRTGTGAAASVGLFTANALTAAADPVFSANRPVALDVRDVIPGTRDTREQNVIMTSYKADLACVI